MISRWPSRVRSIAPSSAWSEAGVVDAQSWFAPVYWKLRNGTGAVMRGTVHEVSAVVSEAGPVAPVAKTAPVHTSNGDR